MSVPALKGQNDKMQTLENVNHIKIQISGLKIPSACIRYWTWGKLMQASRQDDLEQVQTFSKSS